MIKSVVCLYPDRQHYGLDVLYDGFCHLLGDKNVEEVPKKDSLHGWVGGHWKNYPCFFNRQKGYVPNPDLVCLGTTNAAPPIGRKCAILDQEDHPFYIVDNNAKSTGLTLYFKREMVNGCAECEDPYFRPLPFSYPAGLVAQSDPVEIRYPIFWAGEPRVGRRAIYLDALRRAFNIPVDRSLPQEGYRQALRCSQMGLSLLGNGQDCVRYWEIPAQRVMLFAEKPDLVIPNNFVDGESAVFFNSVQSLLEKYDFYRQRPELCRKIALKGHEVLVRHHTNIVRAREVLEAMEALDDAVARPRGDAGMAEAPGPGLQGQEGSLPPLG